MALIDARVLRLLFIIGILASVLLMFCGRLMSDMQGKRGDIVLAHQEYQREQHSSKYRDYSSNGGCHVVSPIVCRNDW